MFKRLLFAGLLTGNVILAFAIGAQRGAADEATLLNCCQTGIFGTYCCWNCCYITHDCQGAGDC